MEPWEEYIQQNQYQHRVMPHMSQGTNEDVGFNPGQVGTRPDSLTKLDFQYKLYEAWYLDADYNHFLKHPLGFMLAFWWPPATIVSLMVLAMASTAIPMFFDLTGFFGIVPTLFTLGLLYFWFAVFVFKVSVVCLIRHRAMGHVFADHLAWTDKFAVRWAPPTPWSRV